MFTDKAKQKGDNMQEHHTFKRFILWPKLAIFTFLKNVGDWKCVVFVPMYFKLYPCDPNFLSISFCIPVGNA